MTFPVPRLTPDPNNVPVGVAEMKLSTNPRARLAAFGLGSCIAITFFDRVARVGALLHAQLPLARDNEAFAEQNPFAFVDSGIAKTLEALVRLGAHAPRLLVGAAGGANLSAHATVGERNCRALDATLRSFGLWTDGAHLGGHLARTVSLDLVDGSVKVRYPGSGPLDIGRQA